MVDQQKVGGRLADQLGDIGRCGVEVQREHVREVKRRTVLGEDAHPHGVRAQNVGSVAVALVGLGGGDGAVCVDVQVDADFAHAGGLQPSLSPASYVPVRCCRIECGQEVLKRGAAVGVVAEVLAGAFAEGVDADVGDQLFEH